AITPTVTSSPTAGLASGSAFPIGTTTLSVSATDTAGNTTTETFSVTVADSEPPVFTSIQPDISVEVDFNVTSAIVAFATPTAMDNSGGVIVNQTQGLASGSSFPVGTTLVEFTVTDAAGNSVTQQFNVTVSQIPAGTVTFIVNSPDDGTVSFSSATPVFNTSVTVAGGTGNSGPLRVVPGTYSANYALPAGFGVTAASCSSVSGNVNTTTRILSMMFARGETYTCTITAQDIADDTQQQIQDFMDNRGRLIMGNRPSQGRRIARVNGDNNPNALTMFGNTMNTGVLPVGVSVMRDEVHLTFASNSASEDPLAARSDWEFWMEARFARYETSTTEGDFSILHAGVDYRINENAILGFGVQFDRIDEEVIGTLASTSGMGWMAGPYYTARIGQNLYFDASLSFGLADNEISPLGTYTDSFSSDRWLATLSLFGSYGGNGVLIEPNITLAYFEEISESYVDSLSVPIASITTRLGDLEFGSRFSWDGDDMSTYFEIDGIYTFEANGATVSQTTIEEGFRMRVGFGGVVALGGSGTFSYGLSYDGIGDNDYEAISAQVGVSVSF
ncbi:HYR domain-containing protein, partial [Alterinioella nitratireducens]|uniref:HYR domain-containing protein n=1 Tax=Alterinioella nitratireducens TaxID=2735915 RepID=UPI004057D3B3